MLGAIDPIMIFQLYKLVPDTTVTTKAKTPLAPTAQKKVTFAVIPLYLNPDITGIYIDSESKNFDISTDPESNSSGVGGSVTQKPIGSTTTINLIGKRGSIGLTILLSLSDLIMEKLVSQEYEVTYMNGAITVFGGLVHGFSFEQGSSNDLYTIKLELARARPKPVGEKAIGEKPDATRLGTTGTVPPPNAPTFTPPPAGSGGSVIQPGISQARP